MRLNNLFLISVVSYLLSGCYQIDTADLIVHNAQIYSCNDEFKVYEAMAIRDGKILQLGPEREILNGYACDNIIDAQNQPVYPGFYDGHCHFLGYAKSLSEVDLNGSNSFEEVVERIKTYEENNDLEWILGRGWDQTLWENDSFPNNATLNQLYPNKPLLIRRVDGHAALANAKALELAGITVDTKIDGGLIGVENGELTGLLLDNAYDAVTQIIPTMAAEQKLTFLQQAEQDLFQVGLTSINDAGIDHIDRALYLNWYENGDLKINDYAMLFPDDDNINFASTNGIYKEGNLHIGSFKIIADGALGSRGACLLSPYTDAHNHTGFMLRDKADLIEIAELAKAIDYQINSHCIGDSANRTMLNIYAQVIQDKLDHRWKIEHAQVLSPNDFDLFEAIKIIPSVQPTHCTSDMRWAEQRLGAVRIKNAYAYKKLLSKAGKIVLGTDFPVEKINPLETFYAAITRMDKDGFPEDGFYADEVLTREEALRGMTIWAAYSNFEEEERGSLEVGKNADFVILTKDIMQIAPSDILRTYVVQTYLGGEQVYSAQ